MFRPNMQRPVAAAVFFVLTALSTAQAENYNHRAWMPPTQRQAVVQRYLRRTNFPVISEQTYQEMVQHYPKLRGIPRENVRVASYGDPALKRMFKTMGTEVPVVGMAVHPNGHPYLVMHRTVRPGERGFQHNTTRGYAWKWDTTLNHSQAFRDGSTVKTSPLDESHSSRRLYFLWAGPGDHVRAVGDRVQNWYRDNRLRRVEDRDWQLKRKWSCAFFLTNTLHKLGTRLENDPNNPFKGVWGRPSKEADRASRTRDTPYGHNSRQVGALSVLDKIKSPADMVLLALPPQEFEQVMQRSAQPNIAPNDLILEVRPQ